MWEHGEVGQGLNVLAGGGCMLYGNEASKASKEEHFYMKNHFCATLGVPAT